MPTLDECKEMISMLANKKGWGSDVGTKIFYAMIELGEAGDIWKHRNDPEYLLSILRLDINHVKSAIAEELIDAIYYCLHALHCLDESLSADEIFLSKHKVNEGRNRVYTDDSCG